MPAPVRASPQQAAKWKHPDGIPLDEVEVGSYYDGIVTNAGPFGVFVNFGAVKDGLVRVPTRVARRYKRGSEIRHLRVLSVDPDSERVIMESEEPLDGADDGPAATAAPPRTRSAPPAPAGRGSGGASAGRWPPAQQQPPQQPTPLQQGPRKARSTTPSGPRAWRMDPKERIPYDELYEGMMVDGVVKNVGPFGVFLDIGAVGDARLRAPTRIGRRFRRGDQVSGCRIDWVDADLRRIQVSLPDPDAALDQEQDYPRSRDGAAPQRPKAASGPASARAGGQQQTAPSWTPAAPSASPPAGARRPLEDLRVGALVDGKVRNVGYSGVFVDIGCGKDARLDVPRSLARQFQKGDEVMGMVVEEVDAERGWVSVSLDQPQLALEPSDGDQQQPQQQVGARRRQQQQQPEERACPSPPPSARRPLEDVRVGSLVDGKVSNAGPCGVFVDIGCVKDARLDVPQNVADQFQNGDLVVGMLVEDVDLDRGWITVSIDEPQLAYEGGEQPRSPQPPHAARPDAGKGAGRGRPVKPAPVPEPPPPPQQGSRPPVVHRGAAAAQRPPADDGWATGQPPARGGGGAAGRGAAALGGSRGAPAAPPMPAAPQQPPSRQTNGSRWREQGGQKPPRSDRVRLEDLDVGAEVSGTVTRLGWEGVFVDFGAVREARLRVSFRDAQKLKEGDRIDGMVVASLDAYREEVELELTFSLGDQPPPPPAATSEGAPPPRPQAAAGKGVRGRAGTRGRAS